MVTQRIMLVKNAHRMPSKFSCDIPFQHIALLHAKLIALCRIFNLNRLKSLNLFRFFILLLAFCTLSALHVSGQDYNLVPNPYFEQYSSCPDDHSQIEHATGWEMWRGTPDFFHACDETQFVGTPLNITNGFQYPLYGQGYGGVIGMTYNNLREIMGIELAQALEIGQQYYIEFYWNRAFGGGFHHWCDCANSHLGALLTTESYNSISNPFVHSNFAHVYHTELLVDSADWQRISGWVEADQPYTHLGIGTFFDLEEVEVAYFNGSPQEILLNTYYYIDGVCVATDPAYCDQLLSSRASSLRKEEVNIYPNPAQELVHINFPVQFTYTLRDAAGRRLHSGRGLNAQAVDIRLLSAGTYIITIETSSGTISKKLIKTP